jgi:hypothetical protein
MVSGQPFVMTAHPQFIAASAGSPGVIVVFSIDRQLGRELARTATQQGTRMETLSHVEVDIAKSSPSRQSCHAFGAAEAGKLIVDFWDHRACCR